MKQKLLLACMSLLMTSCSMKNYYQIVDVKSTNLQKANEHYVYNDGVCKIVYNFWKEGGDAGFSMENLSDEVLYVDLGNTFFIGNGIAKDYGDGINTKLVVGLNSDVSSIEKLVVAIPPHSLKSFSKYTIVDDVIQDCSVRLKVKKNLPDGNSYTESESPIVFSNYITYWKGEGGKAKVVTNDFYIGGINNYLFSDIMKTKKYGCKQTIVKTTNDKYAPYRFFIKYDKVHTNHYSEDAKATSKGQSNDMYYSVKKQ